MNQRSAVNQQSAFRPTTSNAADASLFIDDSGAAYLPREMGWIARLTSGMDKLVEAPRFLKPDPKLFATNPPPGKNRPVRTRVGSSGATPTGCRFATRRGATGRLCSATAPWRRHFGLAPLKIGDDRAIRVLGADDR